MNGTPAYSDEGKVLSVSYPETWAWSNSGDDLVSTAGPAYAYSFDAYNAANQLLTFNTETRTYTT
jgi:hypothetical protein